MTYRPGAAQIIRSAGVIGGLAICVLAGPALPAPPPGGAASLAVGWARLIASGALTALDQPSHTVTLAIAGPARLDEFAGGSVWRPKALAGTRVVHLLPGTLLVDSTRRPISIADVRAGDPSTVWAVVRPDATVLALTLQVTSPRFQVLSSPRAAPSAAATEGVVLERSGSMLDVLTPGGTRRGVVMTAATAVRSAGQPASAPALAPYDILRIEGPVNSDGSIAATRIDVEFAASSAAQVSGPVEWSGNEFGGVIVGGTMIATSADTYILLRTALAPFADLAAGHPVTVYGTAVQAGDTLIGLYARVVLAR